MTWRRFFAARLSGLAVVATLMLSPAAAHGQYTWTGNANRSWDASSLNWTLGSGNIAWANSNPAVFGATGAGAVTVSGTQTVTGTGLTVNAAGYSFTGGQITLGSATTTFTIANDTTIGSVVAGSNQLVKMGAGTLTFTGANTYTGTTTISEGAIKIANGSSNMPGNVINNGVLIFGGAAGASYSPTSRTVSGGGSLVVMDGVTLNNGAWTYSGTTSVIGGVRANTTLLLQTSYTLANTTALSVTGGRFQNGASSSGNDGVSNRINSGASLTLGGTAGGGDFRMGGPSTSTASFSQALTSLSLNLGVNQLTKTGATGTTSLTFTGAAASTYSRATGGILSIATGTDFRVSFTELPSTAAGVGTAAILPGAVLDDNLVGFSGAGPVLLTAATYADTGTTTWTSGSNMNVTGNVSPGSATNVNSIRFGSGTVYTVTLPSGTSVITGGMIMNASTGTNSVISGGTITSGLANASGINELIVCDRRNITELRNNAGFTINSVIADNGSQAVGLTLTSAQASATVGSVVLGGSNSYSGGTVLAGVMAKFATDAAFGSDPGVGGAATPNIRVVGLLADGKGGGLRPTVSGTYTWNQNRTIEVVNTSFTLDPENGTFVIPARIRGTGMISMPVNKGGTLVITGSNTLAGFIDLNNASLRADEGVGLSTAANLRFGDNNTNSSGGYLETSGTFTRSLGSAAGGVQWANSSLSTGYNSGGFSAVGGPLTIALGGTSTLDTFTWGGAAVNAAANLWLQGAAATASLTWRNPIDLGGAARQIGVASTSQGAELAGTISNGSLTKTDAGVLLLTGTNTYAGATTISGGTLQIGSNGTSGSLNASSSISIASGAVLAFARTDDYGGAFANTISGTGGVRVTSGLLAFSATNSYTGATTLAGGVLRLDNANSLPGGIAATGGTSNLTFNGGVLGLGTTGTFTRGLAAASTGSAATFTGAGGFAAYGGDRPVNLGGVSGTITWATANTGFNGQTLILGATSATGMVELQNPLELGNAARTVQVDDSPTVAVEGRLSGVLSGAGGSLTKTGRGTLELTGVNTFTGATTISAGVVSIAGASALQSTSGVSIAGGAGLTYTGGVGTLDRNITVTGGVGTVTNSGAGRLTLAGTLTKNGTVLQLSGGAFNVTGQIVGTSANSDLYVNAASVTLSNTNSYNGPTYVFNSGTLALGVSNAIPSNSTVTLGASGSSSATGPGTLDLGTSTNTIAGLVFSGSGNTLKMAANQTAAPQLATNSSLSLGAGTTLDLTGMGTSAGLYKLVSYTSNTGTFATVNGLAAGYQLVYGTTELDAQQKAVLGTVTVTNPVTSIITGGSAAFTYTVANGAASGGASLLFTGSGNANVAGSSNGSAAAAGTSTSVAGMYFTGTGVGSGQTGTFNVSAPDAYGLNTATGTVSVNVLDHATSSLGAAAPLTATTISLGQWNYATQTWESGTSAGAFSIYNLASQYGANLTADLSLVSVTGAENGFTTNLLANYADITGGHSSQFSVFFDPSGLNTSTTQSATFKIQMSDKTGMSGATTSNTLYVTASVIVVPEPATAVMALVGIALAVGVATRRRTP